MQIPHLHLFNPGHETAVLSGRESYTPSRNVRKMQEDLSLLPLWYAGMGDYVWTGQMDSTAFLASLPSAIRPGVIPVTTGSIPEETLEAAPWGLSPQSLRLFRELNRTQGVAISLPEWKEVYVQLTGRQTAALCLHKIRERLPDLLLPEVPVFCHMLEEVEACLPAYTGDCLLKTPFSSSGRGLLWIKGGKLSVKDREWVSGALRKQDVISIEQGLDKIQDFAMEFYLDVNGKVTSEGLSVFDTAERGAYTGNRIEQPDRMLERLVEPVGACLYEQICVAATEVIGEVFGGVYAGYLGIDMMVYRTAAGQVTIHPCIEINMRYTMGLVALRLYRQYIHPKATGSFYISYDKEAYRIHLQMQEQYPLVIRDDRMWSGYQTLCPVTAETHYRAFILMEESV